MEVEKAKGDHMTPTEEQRRLAAFALLIGIVGFVSVLVGAF